MRIPAPADTAPIQRQMGGYSLSTHIRHPAVAGLFYPEDASVLRATIDELLGNAPFDMDLPAPKALIVPHAGYPYSGSVAAAAYALLEPLRHRISRVVLIGPSHRVYLHGVAVSQARSFATPFGEIPIDTALRNDILRRGDVLASDAAHEMEHCLEVQLPFLQTALDDFTLIPLVVGSATVAHVTAVLDDLWGDPDTLVIATSDLSHYLPYESARQVDAVTATAIRERHTDISRQQACGAASINGLLSLTQRLGLEVTEVARQNSGDALGDVRRVVGYGAFAIHEARHSASQ